MTVGRSSRALRAAVFAVISVLFAVQGHVMMSHAAVPRWALIAGAVVTGGAAWRLAGRERGPVVVGSLAVAGQAVLHALFSLAQAGAAVLPGESAGVTAAHAAGHGRAGTSAAHSMTPTGSTWSIVASTGVDGGTSPDAPAPAGHAMDGMSPTGMVAVHLVSALLCALWLAHGERAAFRILRVLTGWLVAPLGLLLRLPAPPYRPRVRARRRGAQRALRRLLLVHAVTSRGPPAGPAVA
jgi:hypothetical protein